MAEVAGVGTRSRPLHRTLGLGCCGQQRDLIGRDLPQCGRCNPRDAGFDEIILAFVRKEGSIYGPIRLARASMIAVWEETHAYIRPLNGKMYLSSRALMESRFFS